MYVVYDKDDLAAAVVGATLEDALAQYRDIFPDTIDTDVLMAFKSSGILYRVDMKPRLAVVKKLGTHKK